MKLWLSMMCCACIVPLAQIVAGLIMYKRCPKNINSFIGYRTKRSKTNMDTWEFAHRFCGLLWFVTGAAVLLASAGVMLLLKNSAEETLSNAVTVISIVQLLPMVFSAAATEMKLKKTFNDDGTRK